MEITFEVKGRGKTEKMRKGDIITEYRIRLVSVDDSAVLSLTSIDSNLLTLYPMNGDVSVRIGKCNQTTLPGASDDSDEEAEK